MRIICVASPALLVPRVLQSETHAIVPSVQLIMEQLLLKRPGVNHTTLPPQGVGGSDQFRSWVGFWVLNTGFWRSFWVLKYGRFYAKTLKNQHFQKFVTIFNSASSETPHLSVLPVCPSTPRGAWRMLLLLIRKK